MKEYIVKKLDRSGYCKYDEPGINGIYINARSCDTLTKALNTMAENGWEYNSHLESSDPIFVREKK